MNKERVLEIHNFIMQNSLLLQVEMNTKRNFFGYGSRASYYNAVQSKIEGRAAGLIGSLMLLEAEQLMKDMQEGASVAKN